MEEDAAAAETYPVVPYEGGEEGAVWTYVEGEGGEPGYYWNESSGETQWEDPQTSWELTADALYEEGYQQLEVQQDGDNDFEMPESPIYTDENGYSWRYDEASGTYTAADSSYGAENYDNTAAAEVDTYGVESYESYEGAAAAEVYPIVPYEGGEEGAAWTYVEGEGGEPGYYWNESSGETQWEAPDAPAAAYIEWGEGGDGAEELGDADYYGEPEEPDVTAYYGEEEYGEEGEEMGIVQESDSYIYRKASDAPALESLELEQLIQRGETLPGQWDVSKGLFSRAVEDYDKLMDMTQEEVAHFKNKGTSLLVRSLVGPEEGEDDEEDMLVTAENDSEEGCEDWKDEEHASKAYEAGPWTHGYSEEGHVFFRNMETGEEQWEPPTQPWEVVLEHLVRLTPRQSVDPGRGAWKLRENDDMLRKRWMHRSVVQEAAAVETKRRTENPTDEEALVDTLKYLVDTTERRVMLQQSQEAHRQRAALRSTHSPVALMYSMKKLTVRPAGRAPSNGASLPGNLPLELLTDAAFFDFTATWGGEAIPRKPPASRREGGVAPLPPPPSTLATLRNPFPARGTALRMIKGGTSGKAKGNHALLQRASKNPLLVEIMWQAQQAKDRYRTVKGVAGRGTEEKLADTEVLLPWEVPGEEATSHVSLEDSHHELEETAKAGDVPTSSLRDRFSFGRLGKADHFFNPSRRKGGDETGPEERLKDGRMDQMAATWNSGTEKMSNVLSKGVASSRAATAELRKGSPEQRAIYRMAGRGLRRVKKRSLALMAPIVKSLPGTLVVSQHITQRLGSLQLGERVATAKRRKEEIQGMAQDQYQRTVSRVATARASKRMKMTRTRPGQRVNPKAAAWPPDTTRVTLHLGCVPPPTLIPVQVKVRDEATARIIQKTKLSSALRDSWELMLRRDIATAAGVEVKRIVIDEIRFPSRDVFDVSEKLSEANKGSVAREGCEGEALNCELNILRRNLMREISIERMRAEENGETAGQGLLVTAEEEEGSRDGIRMQEGLGGDGVDKQHGPPAQHPFSRISPKVTGKVGKEDLRQTFTLWKAERENRDKFPVLKGRVGLDSLTRDLPHLGASMSMSNLTEKRGKTAPIAQLKRLKQSAKASMDGLKEETRGRALNLTRIVGGGRREEGGTPHQDRPEAAATLAERIKRLKTLRLSDLAPGLSLRPNEVKSLSLAQLKAIKHLRLSDLNPADLVQKMVIERVSHSLDLAADMALTALYNYYDEDRPLEDETQQLSSEELFGSRQGGLDPLEGRPESSWMAKTRLLQSQDKLGRAIPSRLQVKLAIRVERARTLFQAGGYLPEDLSKNCIVTCSIVGGPDPDWTSGKEESLTRKELVSYTPSEAVARRLTRQLGDERSPLLQGALTHTALRGEWRGTGRARIFETSMGHWSMCVSPVFFGYSTTAKPVSKRDASRLAKAKKRGRVTTPGDRDGAGKHTCELPAGHHPLFFDPNEELEHAETNFQKLMQEGIAEGGHLTPEQYNAQRWRDRAKAKVLLMRKLRASRKRGKAVWQGAPFSSIAPATFEKWQRERDGDHLQHLKELRTQRASAAARRREESIARGSRNRLKTWLIRRLIKENPAHAALMTASIRGETDRGGKGDKGGRRGNSDATEYKKETSADEHMERASIRAAEKRFETDTDALLRDMFAKIQRYDQHSNQRTVGEHSAASLRPEDILRHLQSTTDLKEQALKCRALQPILVDPAFAQAFLGAPFQRDGDVGLSVDEFALFGLVVAEVDTWFRGIQALLDKIATQSASSKEDGVEKKKKNMRRKKEREELESAGIAAKDAWKKDLNTSRVVKRGDGLEWGRFHHHIFIHLWATSAVGVAGSTRSGRARLPAFCCLCRRRKWEQCRALRLQAEHKHRMSWAHLLSEREQVLLVALEAKIAKAILRQRAEQGAAEGLLGVLDVADWLADTAVPARVASAQVVEVLVGEIVEHACASIVERAESRGVYDADSSGVTKGPPPSAGLGADEGQADHNQQWAGSDVMTSDLESPQEGGQSKQAPRPSQDTSEQTQQGGDTSLPSAEVTLEGESREEGLPRDAQELQTAVASEGMSDASSYGSVASFVHSDAAQGEDPRRQAPSQRRGGGRGRKSGELSDTDMGALKVASRMRGVIGFKGGDGPQTVHFCELHSVSQGAVDSFFGKSERELVALVRGTVAWSEASKAMLEVLRIPDERMTATAEARFRQGVQGVVAEVVDQEKAAWEREELARRAMFAEEESLRRMEEAIRRAAEVAPRAAQEAGHNAFLQLMNRLERPHPNLLRLRWESALGGTGNLVEGVEGTLTAKVRDAATNQRFLCRILPCETKDDLSHVLEEASIMQELRFPALVRVKGIYPHVVASYSLSSEASTRCTVAVILLEHCAGGQLWDRLRAAKNSGAEIPSSQLETWVRQLSNGLLGLHKEGLLHRNINAGNVYLNSEGRAKFGSYQFCKAARRPGFSMCRNDYGSENSIPPEYVHGNAGPDAVVGTKGDIWGLGCAIFKWTTGLEFNWREYGTLESALHLVSSSKLREALRLCLQLDPKVRASAEELWRFMAIT